MSGSIGPKNARKHKLPFFRGHQFVCVPASCWISALPYAWLPLTALARVLREIPAVISSLRSLCDVPVEAERPARGTTDQPSAAASDCPQETSKDRRQCRHRDAKFVSHPLAIRWHMCSCRYSAGPLDSRAPADVRINSRRATGAERRAPPGIQGPPPRQEFCPCSCCPTCSNAWFGAVR